jgi:hypothetical protein
MVQCDELRPQCKKCLLYGVDCNYGGSEHSLQLSAQGSFQVEFVPSAPDERVPKFGREDCGVKKLGGRGLSTAKGNEGRYTTDLADYTQETAPQMTTNWEMLNRPSSQQGKHLTESLTNKFLFMPFSFISMNSTMATMIDESLQLNLSTADMQPTSQSSWMSPLSYWHFSEAHLEVLARFRDRTALTIGIKTMAPEYRDLLCDLALKVCTLPDLRHSSP